MVSRTTAIEGARAVVSPAGDRWLIAVGSYDRTISHDTSFGGDDPPRLVSSRVVSVDACGGDAMVVAEGVRMMRPPTHDEPWVGCGDAGLVVFDPTVASAGQPNPGLSCEVFSYGDGVVALSEPDGDSRSLVRAVLHLDAPAETTPLFESTRFTPLLDAPGHALATTARGELVDVNIEAGEYEVLRSGVTSFLANGDGRLIAWSQRQPDENLDWTLWDRAAGEEQPLRYPESSSTIVSVTRDGVVSTQAGEVCDCPWLYDTRVQWLPELEPRTVAGQVDVHGRVGDRVFASGSDFGYVHETGRFVVALLDSARGVQLEDDRIEVLAYEHQLELDVETGLNHQALVELVAPDFVPQIVAIGLRSPIDTADGRWLSLYEDEGSSHDALTLIAGDGQTWTLDHDVAASLSAFNGGAPVDGRRTVVGNRVAYLVRDAAEQRTGVWVAELPR